MTNLEAYLTDQLAQIHSMVAELCKLAGARPDAAPDAWTLHSAIERLRIDRDAAIREYMDVLRERNDLHALLERARARAALSETKP